MPPEIHPAYCTCRACSGPVAPVLHFTLRRTSPRHAQRLRIALAGALAALAITLFYLSTSF